MTRTGRWSWVESDQYGCPQVQIKAERKLDFFFGVTFHLSVWSFYKHTVNTAGYKTVMLQHKIGQAAAGRSLSGTSLVLPLLWACHLLFLCFFLHVSLPSVMQTFKQMADGKRQRFRNSTFLHLIKHKSQTFFYCAYRWSSGFQTLPSQHHIVGF